MRCSHELHDSLWTVSVPRVMQGERYQRSRLSKWAPSGSERHGPDTARGLCCAQGHKLCSLFRGGHEGAQCLHVPEVFPRQELQVGGGAIAEADLSLMRVDVQPVHLVACSQGPAVTSTLGKWLPHISSTRAGVAKVVVASVAAGRLQPLGGLPSHPYCTKCWPATAAGRQVLLMLVAVAGRLQQRACHHIHVPSNAAPQQQHAGRYGWCCCWLPAAKGLPSHPYCTKCCPTTPLLVPTLQSPVMPFSAEAVSRPEQPLDCVQTPGVQWEGKGGASTTSAACCIMERNRPMLSGGSFEVRAKDGNSSTKQVSVGPMLLMSCFSCHAVCRQKLELLMHVAYGILVLVTFEA